jgi:hypothetical protein
MYDGPLPFRQRAAFERVAQATEMYDGLLPFRWHTAVAK